LIGIGSFHVPEGTIEQNRDAMAAADPTTFRSELSVYKDRETGRARLRQTPAVELEIRKQRAKSLLELFKRTQRISNPNLLRAPEDNRLLPWLSALDLAERRDVVFWWDDRVMRSLGAHSGVKAKYLSLFVIPVGFPALGFVGGATDQLALPHVWAYGALAGILIGGRYWSGPKFGEPRPPFAGQGGRRLRRRRPKSKQRQKQPQNLRI
jgi:hypothetical protein